MLIDTHCHINDELYINDPDNYVSLANENGVGILLVVGYDVKSSLEAITIAEKYENVYASVGIIPSEVKNMNFDDLEKIQSLLHNKKVIAIGEIGLDYYWDKDQELKNNQKKIFISQIEMANENNLPVSIHCRDAYEDLLNILKEHPVKRCGIIHCFSSSKEIGRELVKLGFCLGIGGTSTFKNANKTKEVVKDVDKNHYVLETDAPYLSPEPFRGKPNHSMYIKYVRDNAALLRNVSPEEIEEETTNNFLRIFDL